MNNINDINNNQIKIKEIIQYKFSFKIITKSLKYIN